MAFRRKITCDIGNIRISDLDMTFNIERNTNVQNNSATFSIYNASDETISNILQPKNNIVLRAGYEDENNLGIIFSGIITGVVSKKDGLSTVIEISATDLGNDLNNVLLSKISLSYKAGTQLSTVVNDVAGSINVPIAGIANIAGIELKNGFSFVGSVNWAIKKIRKIAITNNIGVYFDLGEFVIYKIGQQDSRFGIVRVTEKSGLIGEISDITDDKEKEPKNRIAFASLLNPKIRPNTVINVLTPKKNGAYIVEKVVFSGGTLGNDFLVNVECVE